MKMTKGATGKGCGAYSVSAIPSSPRCTTTRAATVLARSCQHDGQVRHRRELFRAGHGRQAAAGQRQVMRDNAKVAQSEPVIQTLSLEKPVPAALLLCDGRLVGPFPSKEAASYWCEALDLTGFSTYDLIPVTMFARLRSKMPSKSRSSSSAVWQRAACIRQAAMVAFRNRSDASSTRLTLALAS